MAPAYNPNAGGVQRTTANLGSFFSSKGMEVFYLSLSAVGHKKPAEGNLLLLENVSDQQSDKDDLIFEVLKRKQPDIIINQAPYNESLRALLYKYQQSNVCFTITCIHNSLFSFKNNLSTILNEKIPRPFRKAVNNPLGRWVVQRFHKWKHGQELRDILKTHDRMIVLTPPNIEELRYFVKFFPENRVLAIPNALPGTMRRQKKEKIILHVGRINVAQKRSDLLVPFWELVSKKLPEWEFVVLGSGPYLRKLKEQVQNKQLSNISLLGYCEPKKYYERASLFMMPSAFEGLPNTILEAQGNACPILAFDSYAALRWIVNEGEDALLSSPFDVKDLASQAVSLASNEERLKKMQEASRKNLERFTIDTIGQQWMDLFKALQIEEASNK